MFSKVLEAAKKDRAPDRGNIEIEARLKDFTPQVFDCIYKSACENFEFLGIEQSLNSISTDPFANIADSTGKMGIKQFIRVQKFENGRKISDEYASKLKLGTSTSSKAFRTIFAISAERPEEPFQVASNARLRFKNRASFKVDADFRLDITLVHSTQVNNINSESLGQLKKNLFMVEIGRDNFLTAIQPNLITEKEIEIEYIGTDPYAMTQETIEGVVARVAACAGNSNIDLMKMHAVLYYVAKHIIDDSALVEKFRSQYDLRKLANAPISLTKNTYREIFPPLDYYVTEKADGIRAMCVVRDGILKVVADKYYEFPTRGNMLIKDHVIADTELIKLPDGTLKFLVFDVLVIGNAKIFADPFNERVSHLAKAAEILSKFVSARAKEFVKLERDFLKQAFTRKAGTTYEYPIDGLILTSPTENYKSTLTYKWKPVVQATVDFLAKKCTPELQNIHRYPAKPGHVLYLLFVGISSSDLSIIGVTPLEGYNTLFPNLHNTRYMPIQFSSPLDPNAYLYYHPENEDLSDKIIELGPNPLRLENMDDESVPIWKFHRIRTDRTQSDHYFGNAYRTAESGYSLYIDPLNLEDLWAPNFGYFSSSKSDIYWASNAIKSMIKERLYKEYFTGRNNGIDYCVGRGADLRRIWESGVKQVTLVDIDATALTELLRRRYQIIKPGKNPMKMRVIHADLSKVSVEKLVFGDKYDAGIMNFAFHYFCSTAATVRQICKLISGTLQQGATFSMTVMDGAAIFELMKDHSHNDDWRVEESNIVKYKITKKYQGTSLSNAGQMIGVLLPFSEQMYDEYLVNVDFVSQEMELHGMELIRSEGFTEIFERIKSNYPDIVTRLSAIDKQYVGLHRSATYRKK